MSHKPTTPCRPLLPIMIIALRRTFVKHSTMVRSNQIFQNLTRRIWFIFIRKTRENSAASEMKIYSRTWNRTALESWLMSTATSAGWWAITQFSVKTLFHFWNMKSWKIYGWLCRKRITTRIGYLNLCIIKYIFNKLIVKINQKMQSPDFRTR